MTIQLPKAEETKPRRINGLGGQSGNRNGNGSNQTTDDQSQPANHERPGTQAFRA